MIDGSRLTHKHVGQNPIGRWQQKDVVHETCCSRITQKVWSFDLEAFIRYFFFFRGLGRGERIKVNPILCRILLVLLILG